MAKEKILAIDDEELVLKIITHSLSREGYTVIKAYDGQEALELVQKHKPDLVLLDIMLPRIDGIEVCQEIRKITNIPILFITSRDTAHDVAVGFGAGGDDYIKKPFDPGELALRVKAHLRRNRWAQAYVEQKDVLEFNGIKIDIASHTVVVRGLPVTLTPKEFELLVILAKNPNRFFSANYLTEHLWRHPNSADNRSLMSHVSKLRKKIEIDPVNPQYIVSLRGIGYKFNSI